MDCFAGLHFSQTQGDTPEARYGCPVLSEPQAHLKIMLRLPIAWAGTQDRNARSGGGAGQRSAQALPLSALRSARRCPTCRRTYFSYRQATAGLRATAPTALARPIARR